MTRITMGLVLVGAVVLAASIAAMGQDEHSYVPPNGFVPDSITAVRIAVAVWSPIYGREQIFGERPFHAVLYQGTWTVTGSLPKGENIGGSAIAEISKKDGRILLVTHGK